MTTFRLLLSFVGASVVVSWSVRGRFYQRYIPGTDQARSAVGAALSSWKAGEPHQTIKSHTPRSISSTHAVRRAKNWQTSTSWKKSPVRTALRSR